MKKITKNEVIKYFKNKESKNIVFNSFFNCKKIKLNYLIDNVKKDGILKKNLKIELRSNSIVLNGSRLDLLNHDYFLDDDDVLLVFDKNYDNILIYCEDADDQLTNEEKIYNSLIRMIANNNKNFYADYKTEKIIDDFFNDNTIKFSKNNLINKIYYIIEE